MRLVPIGLLNCTAMRCHAGSHPLCAHTYVCMHVHVCACMYMYNTPMDSSYMGGG